MLLTPLAAVAIQVPLLVAVAVLLLQGEPIVRWLRLLLLGLAWLLVEALVQPLVVTPTGPLADVPVVPALVVASMLVALVAAGNEARGGTTGLVGPVAAVVALTVAFLVVPAEPALLAAVAGWVVGTLRLGWVLAAGARRHPGSLLAARLRLLAIAQVLLASAALSVFGGSFLVVWVLPMVTGTLIVTVAVALPPAVRIVPRRTRAALRAVETELVALEAVEADALPRMAAQVQGLFGADGVALTDGDQVVATAGDAAGLLPGSDASPRHVLTASTGRGELLVAIPPIGLLLSRSDREQVAAFAERLGLVLTRDDARRAEARAAAARAASDRVRDDVVSTLSHELRTPLTSVLGFAEVLLAHRGRLGAEQHELLLSRIADRSRDLEILVERLLALTAVRGRGVLAEGDEHRLGELLEVAARRSGHPCRVRIEAVGGDVVLQTDPAAVVDVVEELLRNAVKFAPVNSTVTVRTCVRDDEVAIEVHDEGPGLGHIGDAAFEPFTRGGDVLTRETGGLGIGLTVAREVARQLGGDLAVDPDAPGGHVRFTLPRRHHHLLPVVTPARDDRDVVPAA